MKKLFSILLILSAIYTGVAQETFPENGVKDLRMVKTALTNANIYQNPTKLIRNGTVIIENDKIISIGKDISIPEGITVIDLKGMYIYPAFIELISDFGLKKNKKEEYHGKKPIFTNPKKGILHWNQAIHPEYNTSENLKYDPKDAKKIRSLGYATVLAHNRDGIARGTGMLLDLSDEKLQKSVLDIKCSNHFSFHKGTSIQDYPSSLMGSIALLRQTFYDQDWYHGTSNRKEKNISLETLEENKNLPLFFEVQNKYSISRVNQISKEFDINFIIKGTGKEYQIIDQIPSGSKLIIPINFPGPIKITNIDDAELYSTDKLKHWELAPGNLAALEKKGITVAITADGVMSQEEFIENIRKAHRYGASKEYILRALSSNPANFIDKSSLIGELSPNKKSNFVVFDGDLFDKDSKLIEVWVDGKKFETESERKPAFTPGMYQIKIDERNFQLLVGKKKSSFVVDGDTMETKINLESEVVAFSVSLSPDSIWYFTGTFTNDKNASGKVTFENGQQASWTAVYKEKYEEKSKDKELKGQDSLNILSGPTIPFMDYGFSKLPQPPPNGVLFRNATVWTNEQKGILQNTDVYIQNGKIMDIGKNLSYPQARTIDASGKHLTSGIIDEHSHIAIYKGVNEGSQASSAEVRIGDVVKPNDINIYRQLAGGVTTAQLLHGSANPIGGQSALIKLKWGETAENMKIDDADGFIKFALGENVKQSNWGDKYKIRFPQTRMGVEQVYYDMFARARTYQKEWESYRNLSNKKKRTTQAPRKDLELDALSEILNKERFITCHSYQQGEINMLMHVADSMEFRINTFTHILEGYKVADKMKEHGVGGSTFSDWWAYKFEVNDAIPYNGAILHRMGITTAFNSDDAEMGRRLNQEAAKSIKYGGLSQEEAWKLVTLNPAKLLHLDHRTGSIKKGKDADIVLWSGNPLSVYSKALQTYIDGKKYFDYDTMKQQEKETKELRIKLINKMQQAIKDGAKPDNIKPEKDKLYHCDSMEYEN